MLFGMSVELIIGGIVVGNVLGLCCVVVGVCCDSLIGVCLVMGCGDIVKFGGCVMKNVIGFDLVKLICGVWGMFGVLSEVIFKVLLKLVCFLLLGLCGLDDMIVILVLIVVFGLIFVVLVVVYILVSIGLDLIMIV